MSERLEARGLALRVGTRTLIRDLSAGFAPGQNWAILGANGSGKTTLLHALAGLRHPDHGELWLDRKPLQQLPRRQRARTLGLLFQEAPSALPATVLETVLSGRHPHLGRWQQEDRADMEMARQSLASVGLEALATRNTLTLSGGERRRMELATLLTQDAPICLLDEPVNHLDPHFQIALLRLICQRAERPGHLNLLVLHDVNLALRFCSHGLLLLGDGRTRHGRLDEILDADILESLYHCPMREIRSDSGRLFFPA